MTLEERLTDALRRVDRFGPSPDLFARVGRSIEEDRAHRRRLVKVVLSVLAAIATSVAYVALVVDRTTTGLSVQIWEMVILDLAIVAMLIVLLAPHIRRFGVSYIDGIFSLSPATGRRFVRVLDVAYYLIFAGLALVDLDSYGAFAGELGLASALDVLAGRLGFLLAVMGLLHAINIAFLPFLGALANSLTRLALRREAGDLAPPETLRSKTADRNARALAVTLVVVLLGAMISLIVVPALTGIVEQLLP